MKKNKIIKMFLNIKKISKILLSMYVIVVKSYILNIKVLLHKNHILKKFLDELKNATK
jgi:hypothetical protein